MLKTRVKKITGTLLFLLVFSTAILSLASLTACNSDSTKENNSLVGVWEEIDYNKKIYFNDDNSAFIPSLDDDNLTSYRIFDDDGLFFNNNHGEVIEKTNSKEEALDNKSVYYLDDSTLILWGSQYTKLD